MDAVSLWALAPVDDTVRARFRLLVKALSHDLREPVRGVAQLAERISEASDDASRKVLAQRLRSAACMLDERIRALSIFMHKTHVTPKRAECVPFGVVMSEAMTQVQSGIRVELSGDSSVRVPRIIGHAVGNLLSNSRRYARPGVTPVAKVSIRERDGRVVIRVSDNGRGFAPEHAVDIFGVFRRLYPDVAGTGIGLSIVSEIASQLGGHAKAESRGEGHGATFTVDIPACEGAR